MQPILGRTWLEWIRLSRIFRAPFANLSLEIVKQMSIDTISYLSGLSRIFRKPSANVYISRKVPFAQTFEIYACGPRSYKTFHGFLHDSHICVFIFIFIYMLINLTIFCNFLIQILIRWTDILKFGLSKKLGLRTKCCGTGRCFNRWWSLTRSFQK